MRLTAILLFSIVFVLKTSAQIIPDSMRVDWTGAGYGACFPNPALVLNILSFGGNGDSITNNLPAINSAIDSLNGLPGVIYFPAGIYALYSTVNIPSGVILRGAGADSTVLKMRHSGYGFSFAGTVTGGFSNIIGGYLKGSFRLIMPSGHGFVQGDFAELVETNGAWDTNPASWANDVVGQILRISEVSGDTLILEKELRINYDSVLSPRIRKLFPVSHAGMESMKIFRDDTSRTSSSYNISFEKAAYCWVKAVEGHISLGSHCMINLSTNIEVTGCYFHDANNYDGGGTRGYGVTLNTHAGQCFIANNIFRHLRHAMMTKCGANGNVFLYNYSAEPFRNGAGEFPPDGCGDISLHGHFSYANLFESNVVQTIWIDQTWGPSGPYNTFFRNRAELYGIVTTSLATEKQVFVGNEITNPSGIYGQYIVSTPGTFEYANMFRGTITPPGTDTLDDRSCFHTSRPGLWDLPEWLLIGPPSLPGTTKIPAQRRDSALAFTTNERPHAAFMYAIGTDSVIFRNYSVNADTWLWDFGDGSFSTEANPAHFFADTGHYKVCLKISNACFSDSVCKMVDLYPTAINDPSRQFVVFPLPACDEVRVAFPVPMKGLWHISLYGSNGLCMMDFFEMVNGNVLKINIKELPDGIYFCQIKGMNTDIKSKIIKISP